MRENRRNSLPKDHYYANNFDSSPPMRLFAMSRSNSELLKKSVSDSKLKLISKKSVEDIKCGSFLVESKESSFEQENGFRRSVSDSKHKEREKEEYERH